jgi:hypothetical protein
MRLFARANAVPEFVGMGFASRAPRNDVTVVVREMLDVLPRLR